MDYLYRDLHLPKLTKENCTKLIQGLSISCSKITSHFQLTNGFSDKDVMRREMFFRLRFDNLEALAKFESTGLQTSIPEKIGVDPLLALQGDSENLILSEIPE